MSSCSPVSFTSMFRRLVFNLSFFNWAPVMSRSFAFMAAFRFWRRPFLISLLRLAESMPLAWRSISASARSGASDSRSRLLTSTVKSPAVSFSVQPSFVGPGLIRPVALIFDSLPLSTTAISMSKSVCCPDGRRFTFEFICESTTVWFCRSVTFRFPSLTTRTSTERGITLVFTGTG